MRTVWEKYRNKLRKVRKNFRRKPKFEKKMLRTWQISLVNFINNFWRTFQKNTFFVFLHEHKLEIRISNDVQNFIIFIIIIFFFLNVISQFFFSQQPTRYQNFFYIRRFQYIFVENFEKFYVASTPRSLL